MALTQNSKLWKRGWLIPSIAVSASIRRRIAQYRHGTVPIVVRSALALEAFEVDVPIVVEPSGGLTRRGVVVE